MDERRRRSKAQRGAEFEELLNSPLFLTATTPRGSVGGRSRNPKDEIRDVEKTDIATFHYGIPTSRNQLWVVVSSVGRMPKGSAIIIFCSKVRFRNRLYGSDCHFLIVTFNGGRTGYE